MRLVAQRVVSPKGATGINAFCYLHGSNVWLAEPPPEIASHPGNLVNSQIEVKPPGNRVRSYLDLLAPDDSPNRKLAADVRDIINLYEKAPVPPLPLVVSCGDARITFNAEFQIAVAWRVEIEILAGRALSVRV
jgi:hypothetical protein